MFASKRATQEEFLHTFDALHAEGKQLAVTCDCHPRLNEQFMPELVDRLLGGAVWGLLPPDFDTRLSLLRAKSVRPGQTPLGEDVVLFLAEQLRGNVRELEGALHSIFHYSKVTSRRIDRAEAGRQRGKRRQHRDREEGRGHQDLDEHAPAIRQPSPRHDGGRQQGPGQTRTPPGAAWKRLAPGYAAHRPRQRAARRMHPSTPEHAPAGRLTPPRRRG